MLTARQAISMPALEGSVQSTSKKPFLMQRAHLHTSYITITVSYMIYLYVYNHIQYTYVSSIQCNDISYMYVLCCIESLTTLEFKTLLQLHTRRTRRQAAPRHHLDLYNLYYHMIRNTNMKCISSFPQRYNVYIYAHHLYVSIHICRMHIQETSEILASHRPCLPPILSTSLKATKLPACGGRVAAALV